MTAFDKLCAALAFMLGLAFVVLGVMGVFTSIRAHFTLPPLFGALPAFVGWGILRPVYLAWTASSRSVDETLPDFPAPTSREGNDLR